MLEGCAEDGSSSSEDDEEEEDSEAEDGQEQSDQDKTEPLDKKVCGIFSVCILFRTKILTHFTTMFYHDANVAMEVYTLSINNSNA